MELRQDLPIKYVVGIHHLTQQYPQFDDIIFDIVNFIHTKNKTKNSSNFKITKSDLNKLFKNQLNNDQLKQQLKDHLRYLIDNEYLQYDQNNEKYFVDKNCVEKFLT